MAYEHFIGETLDYYPGRYGAAKLLFRGPRKKLKGDYVAFLGSSETYGKFVETPFVEQIGSTIETNAVNLGCINAGIDVFATDNAILDVASAAKIKIVQVMGAQNMSNRLYTVHKRRNDRFLKASQLLSMIYRDVDFTDFHFTRHFLTSLYEKSEEKFDLVRSELRVAWHARMRTLMRRLGQNTMLLWISDRSPDGPCDILDGIDPLFVNREMLNALMEEVDTISGLIEVVASPEAIESGVEGMVFSELEASAAAELPGPAKHREIADAVTAALKDVL